MKIAVSVMSDTLLLMLFGLPSCGKTTLAKKMVLSELTCCGRFDNDSLGKESKSNQRQKVHFWHICYDTILPVDVEKKMVEDGVKTNRNNMVCD